MKRVKKIEAKNICKAYGPKVVLNDLSVSIEKGSVFCLMGPSGCGKTTLVRILSGLEKADSGKIKGIRPNRISFVFQEDRLIQHLSALSNAILPLKGRNTREKGLKALSLLGLSGEEHKRARELSGGMARRVAIARAMLAPADVVFMDEPFKGLDRENKERAIAFVKRYARKKTVIVVTHSETEARLMNGQIYNMPIPTKTFEEKGEM